MFTISDAQLMNSKDWGNSPIRGSGISDEIKTAEIKEYPVCGGIPQDDRGAGILGREIIPFYRDRLANVKHLSSQLTSSH